MALGLTFGKLFCGLQLKDRTREWSILGAGKNILVMQHFHAEACK